MRCKTCGGFMQLVGNKRTCPVCDGIKRYNKQKKKKNIKKRR